MTMPKLRSTEALGIVDRHATRRITAPMKLPVHQTGDVMAAGLLAYSSNNRCYHLKPYTVAGAATV